MTRKYFKKRYKENITRKGKKKILQEKITKNITRKGDKEILQGKVTIKGYLVYYHIKCVQLI